MTVINDEWQQQRHGQGEMERRAIDFVQRSLQSYDLLHYYYCTLMRLHLPNLTDLIPQGCIEQLCYAVAWSNQNRLHSI